MSSRPSNIWRSSMAAEQILFYETLLRTPLLLPELRIGQGSSQYRERTAPQDPSFGWSTRTSNTSTSRPHIVVPDVQPDFSIKQEGNGNSAYTAQVQQFIQNCRHSNHKRPIPPQIDVPFREDPCFVDRVELSQLERRLRSGSKSASLLGLGGMGKSQLALKCCYRWKHRAPETWVFWLNASDIVKLDNDVQRLAKLWDIVKDDKLPIEDVYISLRSWLEQSNQRKWLLVLDNADESALLPTPYAENAPRHASIRIKHIPTCVNGSIILTSRKMTAPHEWRVVDARHRIDIGPMSQTQAKRLLVSSLTGEKRNGPILELVTALEMVPAAISHAAAYINLRSRSFSVSDYLEEYNRNSVSRNKLIAGYNLDNRRDDMAILKTWHISFDHLLRSGGTAIERLAQICFYDHAQIPKSLMSLDERYCDAQQVGNIRDTDHLLTEDMSILGQHYMIAEENPMNGKVPASVSMHRLVQYGLRQWLLEQNTYRIWLRRSMHRLISVMRQLDLKNNEQWSILCIHAKATLSLDLDDAERITQADWASILHRAGTFLSATRSDVAFTMIKKAYEIRRVIYGDDHHDTLLAQEGLVGLYLFRNDHVRAQRTCSAVISARERIDGPNADTTLSALNELALVLEKSGDKYAALKTREKIISRRKITRRPSDPRTLRDERNLGEALAAHGDYAAAMSSMANTLATQRRVLGDQHPETLTTMHNSAIILLGRGRNREAKELFEEAFCKRYQTLGPKCRETWETLQQLAKSQIALLQIREAVQSLEVAAEGFQTALGQQHPVTRACREELRTARSGVTRTEGTQIGPRTIPPSGTTNTNPVSEGGNKSARGSRGKSRRRSRYSSNRQGIMQSGDGLAFWRKANQR